MFSSLSGFLPGCDSDSGGGNGRGGAGSAIDSLFHHYSLGGCREQALDGRATSEIPEHDGSQEERSEAVGTYTHYCPNCNTARVDWVCTRCTGCEDCCGCGDARGDLVSRQGREGATAIRRAVTERDTARARTTEHGAPDSEEGGRPGDSRPGRTTKLSGD